MSATTQCPTCTTRFKVTQEQLDAHQGLVRCGRCQAVFNATEYLLDEGPSPQLDLLSAAEEAPQSTPVATATEGIASEPATVAPEESAPVDEEPAQSQWQPMPPNETGAGEEEQQLAAFLAENDPDQPLTLAQKITLSGSPNLLGLVSTKKKIVWPWIVGSILLLIVLLGQAVYFFRVELAARQPGLKPALVSYCRLFACSVPLPRNADLISIESSGLEADPDRPGVIALNALLRNHATFAQAYPHLELTLTDAQDQPLARRIFLPSEYLRPDEDEMSGLSANREHSVRVNLDTNDLKPSGYRLFLFYQ